LPCSSDHFIPVLDEINARPDPENPTPPASARKHPGWGGRRRGAGAPKGNHNAFKHGLYSRQQAQILAAIAQVPGVQDALVEIAKRNRLHRKQAEEGMGVVLTRLLERTAALMLTQDAAAEEGDDQANNHDRNNQEFLAFLNDATAQMRILLEKRSRLRRTTIKPPPTGGLPG
jgi:hypothetical protein